MSFIDKLKNLVTSKKFMVVLSFLGLFLLSTGASLAIFTYLKGSPSISLTTGGLSSARQQISELPKTEKCPTNGGLFTKAEKDIWTGRRPIITMIENSVDARPQSGLSNADVVYEAVAEGGITRFMAVFYCGAAAKDVQVAPVRSARIYFVNWAQEWGSNPIFMHVGGANDYSGSGDTAKAARALEDLEAIGWRVPKGNDFDTTYDSGFPVFWRNYERLNHPVATEHTMMASLDAAYKQAQDRGFTSKHNGTAWDDTFVSWKFADDAPVSNPTATKISFGFWDGMPDYNVSWEYDKASNSYLRFNGGKAHTDLNTNKQLSAKNVVVELVKEQGPVDRNKHMLYTTIGEGKALVFQNGTVIEATWSKDSASGRTKYFDSKGKEISFVGGPIWIEAVPAGNTVSY
jgi:Protein of unknown function (DUF3048) N-terminal domain/Protein of unknown function (DUF3048) C-terminal domain